MADEVKNGLSADPSRIPSKWNRQTVADGDWLQKKTLNQLSARDVYLAEQIDKGNGDVTYVSGKVDELSGKTLVLSGELNSTSSFLSGAIDSVSAGVDFVSAGVDGVSSIFDDFYTNEYEQFVRDVNQSAADLDDKIDDVADDLATEIVNRTNADTELQNQIDKLEAATDVICVYGTYSGYDNSFSNASGDLFKDPEHLTENDVIKVLNDNSETGKGGQTYWQATDVDWTTSSCTWTRIGKLEPYYTKSEINTITANIASDIADTYLSAKGAVHQGKNIVVTEDSTKPEITISTSADVEFTNVSATNAFSGNTLTLASTAKMAGLSATNISGGNSKTATIENLIGSANSGYNASAKLATAYWSASNNGGSNTGSGLLQNSFAISAGANLGLDINGNVIKISGTPAGVTAISAVDGSLNANFTGATVTFSAGSGIDFGSGANLLKISADAALINSAQSGQSAYNWITTKSATLSAGQGIGFFSAGPNTLGISADGATYKRGKCIEISSDNSINLSSNITADYITANSALTINGGTTCAYLDNNNLNFSSHINYGTVSARYGMYSMYMSAAGATGAGLYVSPKYFSGSENAEHIIFSARWEDVASASNIRAGSGITIINDSQDHNYNKIYLSALQYNWKRVDYPQGQMVVTTGKETACSSLYFNSHWYQGASSPSTNTYRVGVEYNGNELGCLMPTPPSFDGTAKRFYLASNTNAGSQNESHWDNVTAITADCISSNNIDVIITATSVGSRAGYVYLV